MKTITIEGQLRTGFGKSATRRLRSQGLVPGVIYGGKQEVNFQAPAVSFKPLVYTPEFQQAEVKIGSNSYRCILKDLQFHKVEDHLIHVDLFELIEDKKVTADIPLKFNGTPKGVKDGGRLMVNLKSLRVKTLPKYLKEHIDVDIENLDLHDKIRVDEIKIDHYEILNSPRVTIVSVGLTRQIKEEEVAPAAGAATAATATGTPAAGAAGTTPATGAAGAATPATGAAAATPAPEKEKGGKGKK